MVLGSTDANSVVLVAEKLLMVQQADMNLFVITEYGLVNMSHPQKGVKGILHQKNFYHLNLIFCIVMGCGISRFGRRSLKTTET